MTTADAQVLAPSPPAEDSALRGLRIAIAGPEAPPVGGMTVQAALVSAHLAREGAHVARLATNPRLPAGIARVPKVRGALRLALWRRALHQAIAEGLDVLHVQSASWKYFQRVTAPAIDEASDADVRIVVRWDGGDADAFFAEHGREALRSLRRAHAIVVPSGWLADVFLKRLGLQVAVVPNLVDAPVLAGAERPQTGPLRLLCARHLEPEYGADVVVRAAAAAFREHGVDLQLVVAGHGSARVSVEALAERELPGRVEFLGAVRRERILDALARTDLVVNGSSTDNFPVALAEALAAGVPVATTAAGGIPWVVENGATGLVTPVGDAAALARSIARLADRTLLREMSQFARRAAQRWTWPAVRPAWTQLWRGEAGWRLEAGGWR